MLEKINFRIRVLEAETNGKSNAACPKSLMIRINHFTGTAKFVKTFVAASLLLVSASSYAQTTYTINDKTDPFSKKRTVTVEKYEYPKSNFSTIDPYQENYDPAKEEKNRQETEMRQLQIERMRLENARLRNQNNATNSGNNTSTTRSNTATNNSNSNGETYKSTIERRLDAAMANERAGTTTMTEADYLYQANDFIQKENYVQAIEALKKAVELNPANSNALSVIGQLYENQKNYSEAVNYMQRAVRLSPENIDYNTNLGRVWFNLGIDAGSASPEQAKALTEQSRRYYQEALPYFKKVFSSDFENKLAIYALYHIYYNLDMKQEFNNMTPYYNKYYGK
jgi:tetratricopeptide (TPR) repeat protein